MTTWLVTGFYTFTILTMLALILTAGLLLSQWLYQTLDEDLRLHAQSFKAMMMDDEAYLNREVITVLNLEGMDAALETGNAEQMARLLRPVLDSHALNAMYIIGEDHHAVVALGEPMMNEEALPDLQLVRQACGMPTMSGLFELEGSLWLVSTLEHRSSGGLTDAVFVLGRRLDQEYLRVFRQEQGVGIILVWGDTVASSLKVLPPELSLSTLHDLQDKVETESVDGAAFSNLEIDGARYRVGVFGPAWREGDHLTIILMQSTTAVERAIWRSLAQVIGFSLLLIIGGSLLVYLYGHSIADPLDRLATAAIAIAQGDLSQPIRVGSRDEVGQLAQAFEDMRVQVQAKLETEQKWAADLEEKVRQRTADLQSLSESRNQLLHKTISAQEEERRRVARELHDETSQSLVALITNLAVLQRLPPEEAYKHLPGFRESVVKVLKEVNRIVLNLRPTLLDDYGLMPALSWYAEERFANSGTRLEIIASDEDVTLPTVVETTLFRVGQEAVANAAKYAQASVVRLHLLVENDGKEPAATLRIEDDGCGFDLEAARQPEAGRRLPLGLMGMEERVRLHGGRLEIQSAPGNGTCVCAIVPLSPY